MRTIIIIVLAAPLGGCFGLVGAPKPIPEWAMAIPVEVRKEARRDEKRRAQARYPVEHTGSVPVSLGLTGARPLLPTPIAFSPEWQAQQDAADEKLRRSMNICTGC